MTMNPENHEPTSVHLCGVGGGNGGSCSKCESTPTMTMNKEEINPPKQHATKCPKLYGQKCKCDSYHSFDELYDHRIALWIALCAQLPNKNIWRSMKHSDGTFYDGWFILGYKGSKGFQITYHLPMKKWDATGFANTYDHAPEFDGHTSDDVLIRLEALTL